MLETPTITTAGHTHTAYNLASDLRQGALVGGYELGTSTGETARDQAFLQALGQYKLKQEIAPMAARRLVQVFIADPNENIPLESSLLYSGEQKFTDATDQELFFEIDINSILKKYNADVRTKAVDKKVKDRTEYLEPAKIRDLKMVVVKIAEF